ncbi:MAG: hypothetical protein ACXW18_06225 [Pyrinomonadaceae bacterium]
MVRFTYPLNKVKVAAPCKSEWEKMIGSHRVRFCGQCNLNVYNLSEMTRAQAESLIAANEGRLCVRFYRRRDGSIITRDCPVGLQAIKRRVSYALKAVAAATFTFLTAIGFQGLAPSSFSVSPNAVTGVMVEPEYYEPAVVGQVVSPEERHVLGRVLIDRPSKKKRRAN